MKRTISFILLLSLLAQSSPVLAVDFFDPNFLLSDEELQDKSAMSRADIQAFLNEQGGAIAQLKAPDKDGTDRVAADIIYQASQEHSINPKYLLVKLQKEQSLITAKNPTEKQLDGATGYGITDGCGWSCDVYLRNKGFGKQVDSAAGIMRWYYDNVSSQSWIKKPNVAYAIGNTTVRPTTYATAFLYTYTPHIEGNENFWKLWQQWFDQVYPNGTLVKSKNEATVYLIQDGKKRPFSTTGALVTRFDPQLVITVPFSELGRYETGTPISLPNYALLQQSNNYYLLDDDTLRPFENEQTVRSLGFNPQEIIQVSLDDIAAYKKGDIIRSTTTAPLGRLVRVKENKKIYYIKNNTLAPLFDDQIAKINFPHITIEPVSVSDIQDIPTTNPLLFKDGTLIKEKDFNKVYVIEDGKKRHIASEEVFIGLGYSWGNIIETNQFVALAHTTGQPLYMKRDITATPSITPEPSVTAGQEDSTGDAPTKSNASDISSLMIRTPKEKQAFLGPIFTTDIDAYLIADATTKEIVAGKNIDTVRPLASLTKVMTAYRLMREELPLTRVSTYVAANHKSTYHTFRIAEGEKIFHHDLLDAFLVSSINTPGRMLVDAVEPNESAFVKRMNEQAVAWGLTKTVFTDVTGESEYTLGTAREYMTLFSRATENVVVQETLAKKQYRYSEFYDTDGKPDHFDTHSNELTEKTGLPFTILQSKTGYLHESGANLVMLVQRNSDGKQFIIMTLGNVDYAKRFEEPERLARWAMQTF
ncbi:MAG: D-alanyl-D-alanine carboxypeptidase [Candidatus Magasanikbacteria bacterium]|nr:D-alanyl-D-alanine carboxypeptidase [Candidatus Magasanikbacteria bacterium]